MAKAQLDPEALEDRITEIAQVFARQVVALINNATMEEVVRLGGSGTPTGPYRLATAGRPVLLGSMKRKRSWPTCGEADCDNAYYPASGTARLCYKHFIDSGGRHPSKKK